MDADQLQSLLERYGDGLTDEEALEKLRPEVRDQLRAYAARHIQARQRARFVRRTLLGLIPIAAAACILWLLLAAEVLLSRVVVAGEARELFVRAGPTAPVRDEFWVGIEVAAPCWIHLLERTAAGELIAIRPQASSDDYSVNVSDRVALGPFRVIEPNAPAGPSRVTHVLVIAASQAVSGETLAGAVPDHLAADEDEEKVAAALDGLAETLEQDHGWSVRYQRVGSISD